MYEANGRFSGGNVYKPTPLLTQIVNIINIYGLRMISTIIYFFFKLK